MLHLTQHFGCEFNATLFTCCPGPWHLHVARQLDLSENLNLVPCLVFSIWRLAGGVKVRLGGRLVGCIASRMQMCLLSPEQSEGGAAPGS